MSDTDAKHGTDISPYVELFDDLYAECDGLLESVRSDLLALEDCVSKACVDRALLNDLFRAFHNLKGLASLAKIPEVEGLAHQLENYLRILREEHVALSEAGMEALAAGSNALEETIAACRAQSPLPEIASVKALLDAAIDSEGANPPSPNLPEAGNTMRFEFTPSAELTQRGINLNSVQERLKGIGALLEVNPCTTGDDGFSFEFVVAVNAPVPDVSAWEQDGIHYTASDAQELVVTEAQNGSFLVADIDTPESSAPLGGTEEPAAAQEAGKNKNPASLSSSLNTMRVNMVHMDALMRIMGELVTSRAHQANHIMQSKASLPASQWHALQETNTRLERQLRELREEVMRMRMIPIRQAFERMRLVMRNLKTKTGKDIKLEVYGEDTEMDKLVVERMMDPLLHLVRNAVGHGIEDPATRIAHDKPAAGTIALRAYTSGDVVVIDVEDDGQGIDLEQVMARALPEEKEALPNMNVLLNILCRPGFTTKEKVDQLSGRGVGLDVVKTAVDELGGFLTLQTSPEGTYFSIQLPMTLAIADALLISAGAQEFAIPLLSVQEVFEAELSDTVIAEHEHELIPYRGDALPLLRLTRLFRLEENTASRCYILVADTGVHTVGIVVDEILGKREIVVRALRDPLTRVPGITGAGEFSGGKIALILDLNALIRGDKNHLSVAAPYERKKASHVDRRGNKSGETPYLLFKLAGATYGIPSYLVRQVEILSEITLVPNVADFVEGVVLSRGHVIPALNPRVRFGLEKVPFDLDTRLAVIDTGERMAGIVVDAATAFVTIDDNAVHPPPENITGPHKHYLEGIFMLDGKMVFIPDIEELLDASE